MRGDFQSTCLHRSGSRKQIYWNVMWSDADQAFYAITRNAPPAETTVQPSDHAILVVDDYREISLLVRTALNSAGFSNVDVANGPLKALDMVGAQPYDLVISDLRMEPLNGVDLFSRIRAMPGMEDAAVPDHLGLRQSRRDRQDEADRGQRLHRQAVQDRRPRAPRAACAALARGAAQAAVRLSTARTG